MKENHGTGANTVISLLIALTAALLSERGFGKDADSIGAISLEHAFASPPTAVKPFVHWYWHIPPTREKITQDLEAMQAEGIQGARVYPFDVYMKPEWTGLFEHLLKDSGRLGNIATWWEQKKGTVTLKARVPWNTTATVKLLDFTMIAVNGKPEEQSVFNLPAGEWEIIANRNKERK